MFSHSWVSFIPQQYLPQEHRQWLFISDIVSAIYGDPTLGAKLKFVITRMILYENLGTNRTISATGGSGIANPIHSGGDSKKSLENVNAWNENLLAGLPPNQRHDIAIWWDILSFTLF